MADHDGVDVANHDSDNVAMNWTSIIQALLDSGMTQSQIAEECDTGQSHISGLYRGDRKQPNWELGDRILALYQKRCGKPQTISRRNRNRRQRPDRREDGK